MFDKRFQGFCLVLFSVRPQPSCFIARVYRPWPLPGCCALCVVKISCCHISSLFFPPKSPYSCEPFPWANLKRLECLHQWGKWKEDLCACLCVYVFISNCMFMCIACSLVVKVHEQHMPSFSLILKSRCSWFYVFSAELRCKMRKHLRAAQSGVRTQQMGPIILIPKWRVAVRCSHRLLWFANVPYCLLTISPAHCCLPLKKQPSNSYFDRLSNE